MLDVRSSRNARPRVLRQNSCKLELKLVKIGFDLVNFCYCRTSITVRSWWCWCWEGLNVLGPAGRTYDWGLTPISWCNDLKFRDLDLGFDNFSSKGDWLISKLCGIVSCEASNYSDCNDVTTYTGDPESHQINWWSLTRLLLLIIILTWGPRHWQVVLISPPSLLSWFSFKYSNFPFRAIKSLMCWCGDWTHSANDGQISTCTL